ncbi:hypothetical protein QJS10_CPB21g01264 [Acorus calamus]|uniref:CCHC-type domain-containing protein n=1 Tax=Acorus calamus TaxID=4465 RepID=A0AAV9C4C9_ACOCL|nr:hypothetical protein QJS10_CPB21g01264 [Acorus calamus]
MWKGKSVFGRRTQCFRCLGYGHRRWECRDLIVCRSCRGIGHKAKECVAHQTAASKRVPAHQGGPSLAIQLGDDFNPCEEEQKLRCCVVVRTEGGSPTQEEATLLIREMWGDKFWRMDSDLGGGCFLIYVQCPKLRARMTRKGRIQGR